MSILQFFDAINTSYISQLICLISHTLCASMLVAFMYIHRNTGHVKQNSPLLTSVAQIMIVFGSLLLLLGKIDVVTMENAQNNKLYIEVGQCFNIKSKKLIIYNVLYSFAWEFLWMAYLLKMIRVILITFKDICINLFNKQWKLLLISTIWSLFIAYVDIMMKIAFHEQDRNELTLYPQFHQFFCDSTMDKKVGSYSQVVNMIYLAKIIMVLTCFCVNWYFSYGLQQIDAELKLKKQYFILLLMSYSIIFIQKIIKFSTHFQMNSSLPVHYGNCFANLFTGILILYIHNYSQLQKKKQSLPFLQNTGQQQLIKRYIFFQRKQSKIALQGYYKLLNKQNLFRVIQKIRRNSFNLRNPSQQICKQILSCLSKQQQQKVIEKNSIKNEFQKAHQMIQKKQDQILQLWYQTISYHYLISKWSKNKQYEERMSQLNLTQNQLTNSETQPCQHLSINNVI